MSDKAQMSDSDFFQLIAGSRSDKTENEGILFQIISNNLNYINEKLTTEDVIPFISKRPIINNINSIYETSKFFLRKCNVGEEPFRIKKQKEEEEEGIYKFDILHHVDILTSFKLSFNLNKSSLIVPYSIIDKISFNLGMGYIRLSGIGLLMYDCVYRPDCVYYNDLSKTIIIPFCEYTYLNMCALPHCNAIFEIKLKKNWRSNTTDWRSNTTDKIMSIQCEGLNLNNNERIIMQQTSHVTSFSVYHEYTHIIPDNIECTQNIIKINSKDYVFKGKSVALLICCFNKNDCIVDAIDKYTLTIENNIFKEGSSSDLYINNKIKHKLILPQEKNVQAKGVGAIFFGKPGIDITAIYNSTMNFNKVKETVLTLTIKPEYIKDISKIHILNHSLEKFRYSGGCMQQ
jgi:hypothetical protein